MALTSRRTKLSHTARLAMIAVAFTALSLALSGCGNFFVYPGSTTTTPTSCTTSATTTTGTGTNFAYVTNSSCGSQYLNGYAISAGTLAPAIGSPYQLSFTPQAIVINPAHTFVYIATDSTLTAGNIYGYSIGTGGALSILASGSPLIGENVAAMEVSTDGKYLFSLNSDGLTLEQYSIASTGLLTFAANYPLTGPTNGAPIVPTTLKMAPSDDFLVAALGTGGAETFAYNATTGALTPTANINPASTSIGIYGVTVDAKDNIYTAGTSLSNSPGLQEFSASTTGAPSSSPIATGVTGNGPHGIVLSANSTFVYVANFTDGSISGFSTTASNGILPALSGSPYTAPSNVIALGHDSSGSYLMATGYSSSSGIQIYSIASAGNLVSSATAASGTSTVIPATLALTH
jgi:6-phosphogluconolactonase